MSDFSLPGGDNKDIAGIFCLEVPVKIVKLNF